MAKVRDPGFEPGGDSFPMPRLCVYDNMLHFEPQRRATWRIRVHCTFWHISLQKINSRNAFGLHLIDYMLEMLLERGELENFQVHLFTVHVHVYQRSGHVKSVSSSSDSPPFVRIIIYVIFELAQRWVNLLLHGKIRRQYVKLPPVWYSSFANFLLGTQTPLNSSKKEREQARGSASWPVARSVRDRATEEISCTCAAGSIAIISKWPLVQLREVSYNMHLWHTIRE